MHVCIIRGKNTKDDHLISLFKNDDITIFKPEKNIEDNVAVLNAVKSNVINNPGEYIFIRDSCITHCDRNCIENILKKCRKLECDIVNLARSNSNINGEFTETEDFIKKNNLTSHEAFYISPKACKVINLENSKTIQEAISNCSGRIKIRDLTVPLFYFNPLLALHDKDFQKCNMYSFANRVSDRRILGFFIFCVIVIFISIVIIHMDYSRSNFVRKKELKHDDDRKTISFSKKSVSEN